jgi:hypothetical protein
VRYRFSPPAGRRVVHSSAMLQMLGVSELPKLGLPLTFLPGTNSLGQPVQISVWVAPLVGDAPVNAYGRKQRRCAHRVRCKCPGCGTELSAGRLFQHECPPKHAASYTCDCADCRLSRASPSNPHGYVSRRELG